MKFAMAMGGSRGDVQPAVALGSELIRRGHEVIMAVPPNLVGFSEGAGLPSMPYGDSSRDLIASDLVRTELRSSNPRTRLRAISEMTIRGGRVMQEQLLDLTASADAVIAGSVGQERAHNVAQVRNIAHIPLHYTPMRRNRQVSMFAHLGVDVPGVVSTASWRALEHALWWGTRRAERALAMELGLPPGTGPFAGRISATGVTEIQAYDPALFPGLAAEWGVRRPLVGFLDLTREQRAGVGDSGRDPGLRDWIEQGTEPVYVGFGSMLPDRPAELADALLTAASELDLRLLVSTGWSGFMSDTALDHRGTATATSAGDRVRVVGHVEHDTVLPLCRAAVHHGGAGSVAAGLRAGLPTLVAWVGADQPIWGRVVTNTHTGAALPMSRCTTTRLVEALKTVLAEPVRDSARRLADRLIPPEQAVAAAADICERSADARPAQSPGSG